MVAQKPYHETQLSPQKEQDESTDGKYLNSEVSDGVRSELPDTIRKSGDGESASTLQSNEDGAITCREFDDTATPGAENEDEEYHRKMTFKLEPNVFSPKHNLHEQLPN